jgi:hypothetical protein
MPEFMLNYLIRKHKEMKRTRNTSSGNICTSMADSEANAPLLVSTHGDMRLPMHLCRFILIMQMEKGNLGITGKTYTKTLTLHLAEDSDIQW